MGVTFMSGSIGIANENENENENETFQIGFTAGGVLPGSTPLRPVGVSPSIQRTKGGWFVGQKWPPTVAVNWPNAPAKWLYDQQNRLFFPGSPWTVDYYPIVVLSQFVAVRRNESPVRWDKIELPPPKTGADLDEELQQLAEIMDYRPGVALEALAQCNGIIDYFRGILSFTSSTHPKTFGLAAIAIRVGEFQVMHYKAKYNRPRPSRLSPRLMPLIEVPGHASYPSGHSTQAHLVARCLEDVMPVEVALAGAGPEGKAYRPLQCLADRIARNREVMGLHYPSDSSAGKRLAAETYKLLKECPTVKEMIDGAKSEWGRGKD
jgi:hypothetical protein